jgi:hypothetical protein
VQLSPRPFRPSRIAVLCLSDLSYQCLWAEGVKCLEYVSPSCQLEAVCQPCRAIAQYAAARTSARGMEPVTTSGWLLATQNPPGRLRKARSYSTYSRWAATKSSFGLSGVAGAVASEISTGHSSAWTYSGVSSCTLTGSWVAGS